MPRTRPGGIDTSGTVRNYLHSSRQSPKRNVVVPPSKQQHSAAQPSNPQDDAAVWLASPDGPTTPPKRSQPQARLAAKSPRGAKSRTRAAEAYFLAARPHRARRPPHPARVSNQPLRSRLPASWLISQRRAPFWALPSRRRHRGRTMGHIQKCFTSFRMKPVLLLLGRQR